MATAIPIKLVTGGLSQYSSTDTVPTNNLGSGSANDSTYLRGDGTWVSDFTLAGGARNMTVVANASSSFRLQASGASYTTNAFLYLEPNAATPVARLRADSSSGSAYGQLAVYSDGTFTLVTNAGGTVTFANSTGLNAGALGYGTVPTARLGTGTANSSTYLRGDNTWATVSASVDWANPGTIGSTTPNTGKFSSLDVAAADYSHIVLSPASGSNKAFISKNATIFYLDVNRRTADGVFGDTGACHAGIHITTGNGTSSISLRAYNVNNTFAPEVLRIDGGYYAELTCGQLRFPATQNASSNVNTLDDYEENDSWTPSLGGTSSLTNVEATYTKVGRMVHVDCTFEVSSIGTGSTYVISGLPFTVARYGSLNVAAWNNSSLSYSSISAFAIKSTTTVELRAVPAGGGFGVSSPTFFTTGTIIYFSGWYTAAT